MMLFTRCEVSKDALAETVSASLRQPGWRFGHLTARAAGQDIIAIEVLLLDTQDGGGQIVSAPLAAGQREYPCVTLKTPAAHWAERAVGDFFGLRALGHPRWKSLILHDPAWPLDVVPLSPGAPSVREPYRFLEVKGEGIHEIPVGPIHAGIIEPGHFRFSCVGEIITNLEIRLGYQHRGVERGLAERPWREAHYLAESASSDTAVGNALAHAEAVEQLLGVEVSERAKILRTVALEIERLANHLGDIGAMAGDIGYSPGAALFPPLRGAALALGQLLTGNRRQRWYVQPGGVARDLTPDRAAALRQQLYALADRALELLPVVLEHPAVIERMESAGRVSPGMAKDFGLVGPAARASGSLYDARACFRHGVYPRLAPPVASHTAGHVLARAGIREQEIKSSLDLIRQLLEVLPDGPIMTALPERLPSEAVGIGIVEAWRGELIHWVTTDADGKISRYAIKSPSFNNWTGLAAIAVRNNLVADFPLCNKSFNLSYSGNDL